MSHDPLSSGDDVSGTGPEHSPASASPPAEEDDRPTPASLLGGLSGLIEQRARELVMITALSATPGVVMAYGIGLGMRAAAHGPIPSDRYTLLAAVAMSALAVEVACSWVAMGVTAIVVNACARGETVCVRDAVLRTLPRLRSFTVVWLLVSLLFGFASFLGLVPGLLLAAALGPAIPMCVLESLRADDALRRSLQLTRGSCLRIAGALVVVVLLGGAVWMGVRLLVIEFVALGFVVIGMGIALTSVLTAAFFSVVYEDLVAFKEGGHAEQTAALFD